MSGETLTNTRGAFRLAILEAVRDEATALAQPIEGGVLDGLKVISLGTLTEALERVKGTTLPPVDGQTAEVRTPAEITVEAICPKCGIPGRMTAKIGTELVVALDGAELRLKTAVKARTHVCGQMELPEEPSVDQLELSDIVRPEDALTDEERAAGDQPPAGDGDGEIQSGDEPDDDALLPD